MTTLSTTAAGEPADAADPPLRRARWATVGSLAAGWLACMTMPYLAVIREQRPTWAVLGAVGTTAFGITLAGCLYATATPWLAARTRRWLLVAFGAACVGSVPLVAPVGGSEWLTWAWFGGTIAGFSPMLTSRRYALAVTVAVLGCATAVALATGSAVWAFLVVTVSLAVSVAALSGLQLWLWSLLLQARAGRDAQARLAVTEERLRFARDVHDLLGHRLAVIALKAELAARLAGTDPGRAAEESAQVQHLAATALSEVREAVHGYRTVDLSDQLTAVNAVLRSSGIRCTATNSAGELPVEVATAFALTLREAGTNVLRHSRATWATIEIARAANQATLTVSNDGADRSGPDRHSFGLRGVADRLADLGGSLHVEEVNDVFTLTATVPTAPLPAEATGPATTTTPAGQ
ncbi:two-component system, NarL family, sensor histidine kinase DesK [Actinopolymorpha cephalotaxi]|uniref:Two-component system sensor histidine kinase DesK n=1 Tax=Actinopolymorpha cephalotaxi TaxID=504797 RepID=A0A1I2LCY2_9ACTN|nr:histidine kinase [Actinopolymorpha cephalotaxi]NYH84960.1 two-component system sensor histidine kinase DesK [Actinopolymorpha cephalotaxi]SFF76873.1 two-component system, NarL family, sensor histidine kinase DesK [Actinopolymorpha cephalotaxi]